ncbi:CGNR zinc finger domain-containing protein [Actinomadura barringtoniae]|uniref:CGNR zinc finger domain-containing protein n=1 Tax=Actinomadura barringtoniae TaxID=1427535 RepID=A0A939PH49_9ACTN|nr:CGNR zinc finger domain-containing protein [Actinomadura barringtoniae]MBO2449104.1 CGNR zinc finger domain-containing protein [Actinomadura barringtoniae]
MSEPLIGEPLALDLVNTRHAEGDHLDTPAALRSWLQLQAERLPEPVPGSLTDADLEAVQAVRQHTATALGHARNGEAPPAAALRALAEAQAAAPAVRELTWDGAKVAAAPRRSGPYGSRLAAHLAEAAADLLTDPRLGQVRACEADDCVMLFLPAHPRRRWCSAARCGNRARVARYYERHKDS